MTYGIELSEDLADIEVDLTLTIQEVGFIAQSLLMIIGVTADQELMDVYEKVYFALEPYGTPYNDSEDEIEE